MKFILGAIAIVIIGNALVRQYGGIGRDFQAYYKAGARVLSGIDPYVYENDYPYKYGPAVVVPFLFFQLFSYDVARWIFCIMHIAVALSIPFLNFKLLSKSAKPIVARDYFWALVIGFAASLRFLDGEFQTSQMSLWIYATSVSAVLLLTSLKKYRHYIGVALLAMVSQVKIHSSVMWFALSKHLFRRRNLLLLIPAVIIYVIPNPAWWLEWARQIKETTPLLPTTHTSYNRQGFFGATVMIFNWNEYGLAPWLLSLPFAVYAAIRLPRFSLSGLSAPRAASVAPALLLTLLSWMLWGFMSSPLPWQHTYSLLWGVIPLLWMLSTTKQRKVIAIASMGLALSPKGIIGQHAATTFERYQGPLLFILMLWFVLVEQACAHSIEDSQESL